MSDFQIAETKTFQKEKNKLDAKFYKKIKDIVYPQLKQNPFFGNNIKKLKGEFEGVYRYRFGNYRLFYTIEKEKIIVAILDIKHRQKAYD
ncbi:MAG: type II toxin-antitoxin system RelE/ParE family toxin [Gammaproteobacteria bacterium]|nr:type II toxin-antitoxin system RelE/ParE family toxin [Gammaproteobacteria bacterium]